MDLIAGAHSGDWLAISRLLSEVENDTALGRRALDELYAYGGKATIIGITGPSGSGKSTLVNRLALALASSQEGDEVKIGVIAVDPSSPFSGGALLGDRVRMRDLGTLSNIFIRSMATRGAVGGLAHAVDRAVQVLDAAGFEIILIETVGAGQAEVDIARLAHTTVVVVAPGLGDDIQAAKAGILEIADVLVVNKADKPDAEATAHSLRAMQDIGTEMADEADAGKKIRWQVPIVMTCALDGAGLDELKEAIQTHQAWLKEHGCLEDRARARAKDTLERTARDYLYARWRENVDVRIYQAALEDLAARRISPQQALERLMGG